MVRFGTCERCGKRTMDYDILFNEAVCLALGCGHRPRLTEEQWEKLKYEGNTLSGEDRFTKYAHVKLPGE